MELLQSKGINCNLSYVKKKLLQYFVEEGGIRNLSLGSNYYLSGVAKYYFNGDLTQNKDLALLDPNEQKEDIWNNEVCKRLNALILILRNAYIDTVGTTFEQPEDFGELSIAKLLRKYNKKINIELGIVDKKVEEKAPKELDTNENVGNGYTFEILYSYNDAIKYYDYTNPGAWCITYGEHHYNAYINRKKIHYVIFRKNGFENIPREKGPEWTSQKPQDEYGCSLIALLQSNSTGEPIYITSRWNHGSHSDNSLCEADHAFTKEDFMNKTGVSNGDLKRIYNIWKTNVNYTNKEKQGTSASQTKEEKLKVIRDLKYRQMRINGGESIDSVMLQNVPESELNSYYAFRKTFLVGSDNPKKGVVVYKFVCEGNDYAVVVDRGNILFDTLVRDYNYSPNTWWGTYTYSNAANPSGDLTSDYKILKDCIVITLPHGMKMIYSLKKRKYVDIDGTTKFKSMYHKYIRQSQIPDVEFTEVKMSNNQCALLNVNTLVPLRLPNGSCWFEKTDYNDKYFYFGRELKSEYICKNRDRYISIIYDSSAMEYYYYDMVTKKFLNINDTIKQNFGTEYFRVIPLIKDEDFYTLQDRYNRHRSLLIKNNKLCKIGDLEYFRSCEVVTHNLIKFNTGQKVYFYDYDCKSFLNGENNRNFQFGDSYYGLYGNGVMPIKLRIDGEYINRMYTFYSIPLKSFLINPETNDIVFNGNVYRDCICTLDGKEFKFEDLIDGNYLRKAVVENSAPITFIGDFDTTSKNY